MTQRKLTDDQLEKVMAARHNIKQMCSWDDTDCGREYWHGVAQQLNAMAFHATTDGQPYVEPEPPIPEGYRLAVAGDEGRADCKLLGTLGWVDRESCRRGMAFKAIYRYIVPTDRTPTDEDAKSRPEVMVRDRDDKNWVKRKLICVMPKRTASFIVATGDSGVKLWCQCRYPYPGE